MFSTNNFKFIKDVSEIDLVIHFDVTPSPSVFKSRSLVAGRCAHNGTVQIMKTLASDDEKLRNHGEKLRFKFTPSPETN